MALPVDSLDESRADAEARFASHVTARLDTGTRELPHDIAERLRASRERALAARRRTALPHPKEATGARAERDAATRGTPWGTRIASALPLVALVVGLVAIKVVQDDRRADELAEVDSALLSSELPPAAYTDPGFAQFLKTNADAPVR
nr:DUF3619 family protein [Variovorax dokdonensis]